MELRRRYSLFKNETVKANKYIIICVWHRGKKYVKASSKARLDKILKELYQQSRKTVKLFASVKVSFVYIRSLLFNTIPHYIDGQIVKAFNYFLIVEPAFVYMD